MIELLVVVAVIGFLVVLILPAVQAARAGARKAQCSNNLRQIGIALHAYEASARSFPAGSYYSVHANLLPHLDQTPLYNSINFGYMPQSGNLGGNQTVSSIKLQVFSCSSDAFAAEIPGTNYPGNYGVGFEGHKHAENGVFLSRLGKAVGVASITDGTSHTAAFAEWCIGQGISSLDVLRVIYHTPVSSAGSIDFDEFSEMCKSANVKTMKVLNEKKGGRWLKPGFISTAYNHTLSVNGNTCIDGSITSRSAWTAGSQHSGGAHVAFADGHVQFVRETVELDAWRAIGSRGGGEIVSSSDY